MPAPGFRAAAGCRAGSRPGCTRPAARRTAAWRCWRAGRRVRSPRLRSRTGLAAGPSAVGWGRSSRPEEDRVEGLGRERLGPQLRRLVRRLGTSSCGGRRRGLGRSGLMLRRRQLRRQQWDRRVLTWNHQRRAQRSSRLTGRRCEWWK
ncbi:hypothetical protein CONLIGDRAFT_342464 [Coniochaeta ligniaria NRRL 30616]|uniref:Uncharacterized protein n=1 Tax=Coniochaeta ligniaria NRRL 30616 TaxID=1408157 RepID=A0A1J7JKC7_9PEZI|nr:hypothetical protein CONLIGDRAFT_342464 [Coniochaeta ligniaria NRRL 30616]